jgi:ribonuclease HI
MFLCLWYVVFRGRQPGVYSSWRICQAQVNGFLNNSYRGYQTLEEAVEEFNQFLVDEAMAYQGMVVQALPAQGMALQAFKICLVKPCLSKKWLLKKCLAMADTGLEISSSLYLWW